MSQNMDTGGYGPIADDYKGGTGANLNEQGSPNVHWVVAQVMGMVVLQ